MRIGEKSSGSVALKAGIWYVISNIMVKAVAIITTPIFTRMLSTGEYGTVQTFTSWHSLLFPLFSLNLTFSIGRAKLDYSEKLDEYIGSMQTLSGLFSLFLIIVSIIFIQPFSSFLELTETATLILVGYLFFGVAISLVQNSYRYRYQYKQNIAIAWYTTLATTLLSIAFILFFPGNKSISRMAGLALPTVILSLYFWGRAIKKHFLNANTQFWIYGIKISLPLILHTISMHVLSQSDRIFITKIWNETDTAFYSLAYTYGVLLHVFTNAVSEGWLPWFHDTYFHGKYDEIRKNVKPLIVVGCYIGLACIAFAPEAVMVLGGEKYAHSIPCVPPVVLGVVCQYIYTHYVNIELHLKKTAYVSGGTIIAAIFNIITNAIFIPKYGFVAAAYTTLFSYLLLMLIHTLITRYIFKIKLYDDIFMYGALAVTAVITILIMQTYQNATYRYIAIMVGFLSFILYFRKYIKVFYSSVKNKIGKR